MVGMGSSRYKVCRCIPGAAREELGFWSLQGAQCMPDHAVKKLIQVGRTKRLFRPVGNRERHADTGVGGAAKFSLRTIWVDGLERVHPAVDLFAFAAGVAASPRFLKRLALPFIDSDKAVFKVADYLGIVAQLFVYPAVLAAALSTSSLFLSLAGNIVSRDLRTTVRRRPGGTQRVFEAISVDLNRQC